MAPKLMNILLQRNDSNVQWGFRLSGGKDHAKPLTIVKVFPGTLAAQYLVPGDIVLNIQGYSTKDLLYVEAVELVREPGKSLELVIQKSELPLRTKDDLPASIWGPEPVLQRPSEWLRRSPSPFMPPESKHQTQSSWRSPSPSLQRPSEWLRRSPSPYPNQYFQPISPHPPVLQRSASLGNDYTWPTSPISPVLHRPSDWLRYSPVETSNIYQERNSQTNNVNPNMYYDLNMQTASTSSSNSNNNEHKTTGYKSANTLRQHFESVNQNAIEENVRTGYKPAMLNKTIKERFEQPATNRAFQKFKNDYNGTEVKYIPLINENNDEKQITINNRRPYEFKKLSYNMNKPQEDKTISIVPRLNKGAIYFDGKLQTEINEESRRGYYSKEQQGEISSGSKDVANKSKQQDIKLESEKQYVVGPRLESDNNNERKCLQNQQQNKFELHIKHQETEVQECSNVIEDHNLSTELIKNVETTLNQKRTSPIPEKSIIPSTSEILKRPISPEFIMFPNSKSDTLLKLVLNKSLGNFSPADFEKMKAEEYYSSEDDDDEDSSTEEESDDTEEENQYEVVSDEQEETNSSSYPHSLTKSGSIIFQRYWMLDEENECDDGNEPMQNDSFNINGQISTDDSCDSIPSRPETPTNAEYTPLSRNSSTGSIHSGSQTPKSCLSRSSSTASILSRPGTPTIQHDIHTRYRPLSRNSSPGLVHSRPGTPNEIEYSQLSRNSSRTSIPSRPGTPIAKEEAKDSTTSPIGSRPDTPTVLENNGYTSSGEIYTSSLTSREENQSALDSSRGRQSSQLSGGSTPSPGPTSEGDGVKGNNSAPSFAAPPPPPPPPPPPSSGPLPSVRLSSEIPDSRKGGGYEPPAAIQNAMMTKDKKPFTYTPGGLDLSQIRSPRMQRRITRNANAEGVGDHPQATVAKTSPLAQPSPQGPLPPSALAAMQPQLPVPVFPAGGGSPTQLHHVPTPPGSHTGPAPPPPPPPSVPSQVEQPPVSNVVPKPTPTVIRPVQSPAPRVEPSIPSPPVAKPTVVSSPTTIHNEPGSIYVPPVTPRSQVGSLYIPPINDTEQETVSSPPWQQTPSTASPMSPLPTLNKAPTPWMSQHQRQQQQQNVPSWVVNREEPQPQQQQQQQQQQLQQIQQQQSTGTTRIIPIQVEGRNDPVQPPQPQYQPVRQPQPQQQAASNQTHTRIIPIQIEGSTAVVNSAPKQQAPTQHQRMPVYVHNKFNPPNSPQAPTPPSPAPYNHSAGNDSPSDPRQYQHQQSWGPSGGNGGPIQSRSFRVLQKITDTDNSEVESDLQPQQYIPPNAGRGQWNNDGGVPVQQMRKLELSEDDRALMNKFRAQVDEDSFLHTESDPRYRGAAIPSRAFRLLQNMTDGSGDHNEQVPRGPAVSRGPQTRQVPVQQSPPVDGAAPQAYIPPSEQQVPEPRKYTGGAIPSRSFRMLQAMTAPENCGPGQSDM